jgi:hypothetical protein
MNSPDALIELLSERPDDAGMPLLETMCGRGYIKQQRRGGKFVGRARVGFMPQ